MTAKTDRFGIDPLDRKVLVSLTARLHDLLDADSMLKKLAGLLDEWVTELALHLDEEVSWNVIDPLFRATHDLLSELQAKRG